MSERNTTFKSSYLRYIIILLLIIVLFFIGFYLLKLAHNTSLLSDRGIGLFCDPGPVVTIDCTSNQPCTWWGNNQQYTSGDMCAPQLEGELCSPGIIWDCWWRTTPIDDNNSVLRCQCWPT